MFGALLVNTIRKLDDRHKLIELDIMDLEQTLILLSQTKYSGLESPYAKVAKAYGAKVFKDRSPKEHAKLFKMLGKGFKEFVKSLDKTERKKMEDVKFEAPFTDEPWSSDDRKDTKLKDQTFKLKKVWEQYQRSVLCIKMHNLSDTY